MRDHICFALPGPHPACLSWANIPSCPPPTHAADMVYQTVAQVAAEKAKEDAALKWLLCLGTADPGSPLSSLRTAPGFRAMERIWSVVLELRELDMQLNKAIGDFAVPGGWPAGGNPSCLRLLCI